MKKTYSPEFKAKAVLELLREEDSIGQISSKYEVHSNQLSRWRKTVIEGMPELLSDVFVNTKVQRLASKKYSTPQHRVLHEF